MPVTEEPRGLVWINNVNMGAFGPLVTQLLWAFGSVAFTCQACLLLGAKDPNGMTLAGLLLAAWTGKTAAGIYDNKAKREADPRFVPVLEAKERGKVVGTASALALKESAKDASVARQSGMWVGPVTGDHPAQNGEVATGRAEEP